MASRQARNLRNDEAGGWLAQDVRIAMTQIGPRFRGDDV
jgi:hypothetical protein